MENFVIVLNCYIIN